MTNLYSVQENYSTAATLNLNAVNLYLYSSVPFNSCITMIGVHDNIMNTIYVCKKNVGTDLVQFNLMGLWTSDALGIDVVN